MAKTANKIFSSFQSEDEVKKCFSCYPATWRDFAKHADFGNSL